MRRYHKRQQQYGVPDGFEMWFPKPKGMHLKTYNRRLEEMQGLSDALDARFMAWGINYMGGIEAMDEAIRKLKL